MFAEFLDRSQQHWDGGGRGGLADTEPVAITGAALGTPGTERLFDDGNLARLLHGEQLIDVIPSHLRDEILDKRITRLVKGDDGTAAFETIDSPHDVIKLAARAGELDLAEEFGVDKDRLAALGRDSQLAIAAGIEALRDAGIPLVQHYKTTTKDTKLPDRWALPEELRDDTGVIFASAFPGMDEFAAELNRYWADRGRREQLQGLESLRARLVEEEGDQAAAEIDRRIHDLRLELERSPYRFDRRFLFRVLSMGHSQFAELIGARGPNTQLNAACASTTQAVAVAEDWIRTGRCRRTVIVAADDATSEEMLPWIGAGFLASGAAATDEAIEDAALPFDRRRHGMLLGMGAAALVVESASAARERGIQPICEVLGVVTANSAFHGTRLDVDHIGQKMEEVVRQAEARGEPRHELAGGMVFVSHETYTPARGGSAAAEIHALRKVFGRAADRIVIANTKGFTGHPMGVGIEDVVAVKALETGIVPPVPNFEQVDPDLGELHLSRGGSYPIRCALRLAAGFGSQISMMLLRWTPVADGRHRNPEELGFDYRVADREAWSGWLRRISGQDDPQLEVEKRRLRVVDRGPSAAPTVPPEPSATAVPLGAPETIPSAAAAPPEPVGAPPPPAPAAPSEPPPVAAPPVTPTEPAPVAAEPTGAPSEEEITARILELVAEETGYPSDMLDPELDLEADLGIDTVKQAEVFATIREAYGIERDDTLKLRDYPTINHVVAFVRERAGGPAAPPEAVGGAAPAPAAEPVPAAEPAPAAPEPTAAPSEEEITARILELVAEETGYPSDMLDPELDLEADLGIDTVKQAEVFATIREAYGIERDDTLKLRDYPTINHVVAFVRERAGGPAAPPEAVGGAAPAPAAEPVPAAEPAPAAPEPTAAPSEEEITARILELVAEETGYPSDMLDPELDLEADLGIDTVKQAEVFATIREAYGIERDDTLKLRDYPTINHVVAFVRERAGGPAAPPEAAAAAPADEEPAAQAGEAQAGEEEGFGPRVPVPILRPPLDRCVTTGVELGAGSRVVLMPDRGGVGAALGKRLTKLGVEVLEIEGEPQAEELEDRLAESKAQGPIQGVYWLPALDDEGPITSLDPASWREGLRMRVKLLATAMRVLADQVSGPGTFLVSATRLGGRHGYDAAGATSVMGGAVAGFTKALARERDEALVKVVDFAPSRKTAALAELLLDETLRDPGAVEVGHADELRWTVGLAERPPEHPARELTAETTFLVTGAAGSIVSAITADLASASGGTFHLFDLVPEPDPDDPDLERFASDQRPTQARSRRAHQGARRAPDAEAGRARAGADRAGAGGPQRARGDSRSGRHRALAPGGPHRPGAGGRGRRVRSRRRPASTSSSTPPGSRSATSCPTSRRRSTTSSSTSRPTAGSTCCTRFGTPTSGRPWSSVRSRLGSATPARPTTRPPTTFSARAFRRCGAGGRWAAASRSTGRRGRRSGWQAAARSRR